MPITDIAEPKNENEVIEMIVDYYTMVMSNETQQKQRLNHILKWILNNKMNVKKSYTKGFINVYIILRYGIGLSEAESKLENVYGVKVWKNFWDVKDGHPTMDMLENWKRDKIDNVTPNQIKQVTTLTGTTSECPPPT